MDSSLSDTCTSSNDRSSPNVLQVDRVDEEISSLGNFALADFPSRDEVVVVKQLPAETHDDKSFLREQLNTLECPFTWKIQNGSVCETPESVIARTDEKIEEIEEESTFQWRKFTLTLITCYENFCKGNISVSWDKQRICENIFHPSDSKGMYESFFQATKDALSHVIYSCKCHLFFETGVLNEARQTLQKVCKYEEMDNPCKAAIWGIRAAVSMEYGYEGTKVMCPVLVLECSCV